MSWNEIILLIERAQNGDRQAFGELVDRFHPAVYAVALARLRNANEAMELTQEVFVHAMTRLDQLRDPHCFTGWLRQITVRMAINRLTRRAPLRGGEPEILDGVAARGPGPLDQMVLTERAGDVWNGLRRLKPLDRETLEAFYIRGR